MAPPAFVGIDIAVILVTASIVFAGILIGIGRGIGYKNIEQFGMEELIQSIINAAIIGAFATVTELVGTISSTVVAQSCSAGNALLQLNCVLTGFNSSMFLAFQQLTHVLNLLSYYQSLTLDFGAFSISPFGSLSAVSAALSAQLLSMNVIMIVVGLNQQIATFIGQNALALLFPVGLVLRTFFATRKVGGFLIALAIGLYIFYPVFVLVFPNPTADINLSTQLMTNFTNNGYYAAVPVVDLNSNYAIAGKIDVLSGRCSQKNYDSLSSLNLTNNTLNMTLTNFTSTYNISNPNCYAFLQSQQAITANNSVDFSGDLTMMAQSNSNALSKSLLYSVVAPLFSLIITIVFVRELATILGSEIGFKTFANI